MKSLKVKLSSALIMLFVAIAMLIVGIYAAETQSIKLNGTVNFDIKDKCLYVQDVRLQESMESSPYSLKEQGRFMPGYVNGNFNMNLGTFTNTYGSFVLYFDIINTIDETSGETFAYTVESNTTQSGVSVSVIVDNESNTIPQGTVTPSQITQDTSISASLKVTIRAQTGTNVDLSQITITISEFVGIKINAISSNETIGQAQSTTAGAGEVTLTATFTGTQDGDFLGWRADTIDGELISTLPSYTFALEANSPTTYWAIFETPNALLIFVEGYPDSEKATLSSASGDDIIVPAAIYRNNNKYIVTNIEKISMTYAPDPTVSNVFNANVKKVILPDTLINIAYQAFSNCSSLTSINIPDSVTSIGDMAFYNCSSLTGVYISDIEAWCKINFNSGTSSNPLNGGINGASLYLNGELVTNLVIPDGVTSIGDFAFTDCSSLESVTIPDSVESIGDYAFSSCTSLTSVSIGKGVTSIGSHAFYNYISNSLTSIEVDENNMNYTSDEYGVLYNKDKTTLIQYPIGNTRTTFEIPDSVTSIGNYAFAECSSLTSVTIPDSVTSIGNSAFEDCSSLTSVTIGSGVTSINRLAFTGCSSLTSVTIPDSVTSIGNSAFEDCSSLTSVIIGSGVTSISDRAFFYCSKLINVTINAVEPPTFGNDMLEYCSKLAKIYVPAESIDKYKAISGWSSYASKISAIQ